MKPVDEEVRRLWLKLIVKPSDDLPNQEKNQFWTVLLIETKGLYTKQWGDRTGKGDKEWINKITNLLEEGKTEK